MNEILSHLLVTLIYFLIVSLLRFNVDINLLWLWIGALFGTFLLDIDHLIYWFYLHPEKEDSMQAKVLLKFKNYKGIYRLLIINHKSHNRLVFHSAIFQVVLILLAFYILSSSRSLLGIGLILALNLHLLKDEWQDFLKSKERLSDWLFWQIQGFPAEKYLKIYLTSVSIIFLLLILII